MVFNDEGSADPIVRGVQLLEDADLVVGHNIIGYDLPVLRKLYGWFGRTGDCLDTLLLSRLYHPNLMEIDKQNNWEGMPLKLYGSHGLEAYGYRLKEHKGTFAKETDWSGWSQDMQDYCVQDVKVTTKLCDHFHPYLNGSR
jgi:hypothetical protein